MGWVRDMTTDTSAPMSARSKFVLLLIAATYTYCVYAAIAAIGDPINWTAAAVGVAAPFVIKDFPLLRNLPGWATVILAALALNFVVPDQFANGIELGLAALAAVGLPLYIAGWIIVRLTADIPDETLGDTADQDEDQDPPSNAPTAPTRAIVGLSGYAGAGKDTAAAALIERGFTRVSFADVIRQVALAINPLIPVVVPGIGDTEDQQTYMRLDNVVQNHGWTDAKKNLEVRGLLQRLGTEAGRQVLGENVWVDAVMNNLPEGDLVFTDMRFPNEYDAIVNSPGGIVVRITRPGFTPVNAHPSETALDGHLFHATIENTQDREHVGLVLAAFLKQTATPQLML